MNTPLPHAFADTRLAQLFEAIPLGVFVFRLEDTTRRDSLRIVFANRVTEGLLGLHPSLTVGRLIGQAFPNSLEDMGTASVYRDVILAGKSRDLGMVSYGDERVDENRFSVTAHPLDPETVAVLFDNMSATSARRTELVAIVESAEDAIVSTSLDATILTWNAAAEKLYGYTAAEAVGRPITLLLPPDRPDESAAILARLAQDERIDQFETVRVHKDGSPIEMSLTVSPVRDSHGRVVGAASIAREIGERKRADARIRELGAIVETSEDAIISRSPDGIVRSWNPAAERLFGYSAEEMVGNPADVLVGPDDGPEPAKLRASLTLGERHRPFETRMRRKDGSTVHVSVAASPITDDTEAVVGVGVVIRDISEQRQLEEQLNQAQKMEAIGNLAGGIAHDFNNLLTVIRTVSSLVLRGADDPKLREHVGQIDEAAARAAELTSQLLSFSRRQMLRPVELDLDSVVTDTLKLLERLIGEDVTLVYEPAPWLPAIVADRSQVGQVILNLAINARDAMAGGGTIVVRTAPAPLDAAYARDQPEVVPGEYALLEITDTGLGMDEATQARVFEPFFTTKAEGTGLGLATVYGVVKQSGGHVSFSSEPGLGTTFRVYFRAGSGPAEREAETVEPDVLDGTETILLVEDADIVRVVVKEVLESYGYRVLEAASGFEALELAAQNEGTIDLLLTDMVMPQMHGTELAATLAETHPSIRQLFTSGYPAGATDRKEAADPNVHFIQKPYIGDELVVKIRSVLDSPG